MQKGVKNPYKEGGKGKNLLLNGKENNGKIYSVKIYKEKYLWKKSLFTQEKPKMNQNAKKVC